MKQTNIFLHKQIIKKKYPNVEFLRDATLEMLAEVKAEVSEEDYKRAEYVIEEIQRVLDVCEALERNDYETVGQKMYETHHGMSKLYEVSCEELDFLNDIAFDCGVTGSRVMGGFTTGRKEIIDLLRQRSRPYLFSNSLAPGIIGASLEVFKMLKESNALHDKLLENVNYFRDKMTAAGFDIKPTQSAICAVMLYDAKLSQIYATRMQEEGIYVTGFYYPVVPKDQARIRVQISAGHEKEHLDKCIAAFIKVGKELGVLK
jgi:glycine C-acetyltransferase